MFKRDRRDSQLFFRKRIKESDSAQLRSFRVISWENGFGVYVCEWVEIYCTKMMIIIGNRSRNNVLLHINYMIVLDSIRFGRSMWGLIGPYTKLTKGGHYFWNFELFNKFLINLNKKVKNLWWHFECPNPSVKILSLLPFLLYDFVIFNDDDPNERAKRFIVLATIDFSLGRCAAWCSLSVGLSTPFDYPHTVCDTFNFFLWTFFFRCQTMNRFTKWFISS